MLKFNGCGSAVRTGIGQSGMSQFVENYFHLLQGQFVTCFDSCPACCCCQTGMPYFLRCGCVHFILMKQVCLVLCFQASSIGISAGISISLNCCGHDDSLNPNLCKFPCFLPADRILQKKDSKMYQEGC